MEIGWNRGVEARAAGILATDDWSRWDRIGDVEGGRGCSHMERTFVYTEILPYLHGMHFLCFIQKY